MVSCRSYVVHGPGQASCAVFFAGAGPGVAGNGVGACLEADAGIDTECPGPSHWGGAICNCFVILLRSFTFHHKVFRLILWNYDQKLYHLLIPVNF